MKSFKHILPIVAISLIPLFSVLVHPDMIHTHDGPMHLARVPAYLTALSNGQIMPRWAANLNYGYGMPLFNFYYHLPYLLGALFVALGTSLVLSFKLSLLVSFLFSGITMYLFASAFFQSRSKGLVTAVLYQFAPFHLVDLVVRGDPGELLAMGFLPLVLLFIHKKRYIAAGISSALLILSHSAVSLMYFGVIALFITWLIPGLRRKLLALASLCIGLSISAFYWIPVLFERRFTYGDVFMKDMFREHFVPYIRFFIPNLTNNTLLHVGGVDISFGLVHTMILFIAIWTLIKKRKDRLGRSVIVFGLIATCMAYIFMTPLSIMLWENISVLRAFQFPWRFLVIPVFSLSFLTGVVLPKKPTNNVVVGILLLTLISTISYWRPPLGYETVDEQYYQNYPLNTTYFGETDLVWSAGRAYSYPETQFEIIEGEGSIQNPKKSDTTHTLTVHAETEIRIRDNTQYYPGWRVYSDGYKIPIEFQDPNNRGVITFRLPEGVHDVVISFGETPVRAVAEIISVSSVLILFFLPLIPNDSKKKQRA